MYLPAPCPPTRHPCAAGRGCLTAGPRRGAATASRRSAQSWTRRRPAHQRRSKEGVCVCLQGRRRVHRHGGRKPGSLYERDACNPTTAASAARPHAAHRVGPCGAARHAVLHEQPVPEALGQQLGDAFGAAAAALTDSGGGESGEGVEVAQPLVPCGLRRKRRRQRGAWGWPWKRRARAGRRPGRLGLGRRPRSWAWRRTWRRQREEAALPGSGARVQLHGRRRSCSIGRHSWTRPQHSRRQSSEMRTLPTNLQVRRPAPGILLLAELSSLLHWLISVLLRSAWQLHPAARFLVPQNTICGATEDCNLRCGASRAADELHEKLGAAVPGRQCSCNAPRPLWCESTILAPAPPATATVRPNLQVKVRWFA